MAGRSSTRHKREIHGIDLADETAPEHGETNDWQAKLITPKTAGGEPSRTLPDSDGDGFPDP